MFWDVCQSSVTPAEGFFAPFFFFADSISGRNRDVIWSLLQKRKPAHSKIKGLSLTKTLQFLCS